MTVKDIDRPVSLITDEVYAKEYCEVGDIVKIKSTNMRSLENQVHGAYLPDKAMVVGIYSTFIRFNNGKYNFCLDKADLFCGAYKIRKVKR